MLAIRHPVLTSGLVLGILFLGNASINDSHAWPLVWPLVGGALAVALTARRHAVRWSEGIGLGAKAGLVGLLVTLVAGTPVVYLQAGPALEHRFRQILPLNGVLLVAVIMLALGVLNTIVATLGGTLALPFVRTRHAA